MITPQTDKKYTVVHAFSGSGGCSSGFDEEGFETLAALDFDADACADLDYLLNRKVAVVVDIEKMEPADMRRIVGDRRPDVYVATPPCKGWSRLLGKGRRMSDKYVRMCSLAVRSVWLALHAWDEPPPLIVIENVRGMSTEGREMMDIIKRELRAFGYLFDIRTWNVGKIGNLAQSRDRCLFVARDPKRCPAFLMVPTEHPLRPCGDELGKLPPPTLDKASKSMHKLPQLSAMNWLRIAAIPPGKDWKALPPRIQLGGNPKNRHDSKFGVEDWNAPAHTVTGVGSRVPSGRSAVAHPVPVDYADPRARPGGASEPRNGNYGVEHPGQPAHTVRGEHRVWSAPASYADPMGRAAATATTKAKRPRKASAGQEVLFDGAAATTATIEPAGPGVDLQIADRDGRQSGGFGVNAWGSPAHTVVGHTDVSNTWASTATPITFTRSWSAGRMGDRGGVDPRLDCSPRNGAYGVQDPAGYPEPTHWLVRDEAGGLVLLGPEITDWDEICYLVIMTEDEPGVWSWHRPMTDLELAVLQSLPAEHNGAMLALRGPSGKRREHIGNMLPKAVAKAIARACRATLDQPHATFQLVGKGKIWVRQRRERAPVHAEARA